MTSLPPVVGSTFSRLNRCGRVLFVPYLVVLQYIHDAPLQREISTVLN
jgi:hypothetical protein